MSRPIGYRNQNSCRNCKFVYRSDLNCYCVYDGYPVPTDKFSILGLEQSDEFSFLEDDDNFYKWKSDNIISGNSICDSHEEEL